MMTFGERRRAHEQLSAVESAIGSICRQRGVDPNDLEHYMHRFTVDEEEQLLFMLQNKLELQEAIFKDQGGDLSNVIFLESRR